MLRATRVTRRRPTLLYRPAAEADWRNPNEKLYRHELADGTEVLVKRITGAKHAELLTAFCTACARDKQTDQVLCFQRTLAKGEVVGLKHLNGNHNDGRKHDGRQADPVLPLPQLRGRGLPRWRRPDQDIHAGETYHCNECGAPVVLVALNMEMLANPAIIRWNCHFCKPGPCRLAPSSGASGDSTDSDTK